MIEFKNVSKHFGPTQVLHNIDLNIAQGEVVVIIGPSGSGKSTLLRCINKLEEITSGDLIVDGLKVNDPKVDERLIRQEAGMVFQQFYLFPHLTALENVMFGPLRVRGANKEEAEKLARELLAKVGLAERAHHYPSELSGGQQQRVAIARALVNQPKVLLLDEPLGALDLRLRKDMQNELKRIQQQTGITFIYVTHDQEEALAMSDTIVVMNKGHIQQIGTPEDIYNEPQNAFVADFIGESNILDGCMHQDFLVEFLGTKVPCVDKGFAPKEKVDVVIRPEDIDIVAPDAGLLHGVITSITFKGIYYDIIVDIRGFKWLIQTTDFHPLGAEIGIVIPPDDIHVMKKSVYSDQVGDYSSYSDEYEEINDPNFAGEDGNEEAAEDEF